MTAHPSSAHDSAAASPTTSAASASLIVSTVARLLADYALQLRDDLGAARDGATVKREDGAVGTPHSERKSEETKPALAELETEEAAELTDADLAECKLRLQRIQRVRRILREFDAHSLSGERTTHGAGLTSHVEEATEVAADVSGTVRRNRVLTIALSRFEMMVRQLQGTSGAAGNSSQPVHPEKGEEKTIKEESRISVPTPRQKEATAAVRLQPLLNPVPLQEGALAAFSRNINIVFRRRPGVSASSNTTTNSAADAAAGGGKTAGVARTPLSISAAAGKRAREDGQDDGDKKNNTAAEVVNFWSKLSFQQRKARFALYTLRSALLPRVNRVCAPFYVSPAVRELAQLNAAAERAMLERVWCVHTKAHLLREAPSVARDVEASRQTLRDTLTTLSPAAQEELIIQVSYVRFLATDGGIVRACVQHVLYLDVTYDVRQRRWMLLEAHWRLYTTPAGASLLASGYAEADRVPPSSSSTPCAPPPPPSQTAARSIQPENKEALLAFLQKAFSEDGLSGGLRTANRLVCAVVLDVLALQLLRLQQTFFTGGPLARCLETEVRPGTFISFHLSGAGALAAVDAPQHAPSPSRAGDVVHVKITACGATIVMEQVVGTKLSARSLSLLLGSAAMVAPTDGSQSAGGPGVLLDMEALIWRCFASAAAAAAATLECT